MIFVIMVGVANGLAEMTNGVTKYKQLRWLPTTDSHVCALSYTDSSSSHILLATPHMYIHVDCGIGSPSVDVGHYF